MVVGVNLVFTPPAMPRENVTCVPDLTLSAVVTNQEVDDPDPNKISTYKDKKILGDYLRGRMKLKVGTYVTENHFKKYGRDTITISRISDGVYYFDFNV